MKLPKPKTKKIIKEKEFVELAKKVQKSFEEERQYVHEKKVKNADYLSAHIAVLP